jgi:mono/diheme cytochrome c family protein
MARGFSAGFAMFCVMAMGVVGRAEPARLAAAQAKPAANAAAKALKNPVPANAASVEAGKAVFAKYCRSCHGAEGKGDGAGAPKDVHPANLASGKFVHGGSDGEIFTTIKMGVPPKFDMDSWDGRIKDPDIWNLVNYIRTLGPKPAAKK